MQAAKLLEMIFDLTADLKVNGVIIDLVDQPRAKTFRGTSVTAGCSSV